jgi:predicted PurR-regulated permease PerM
LIPFALAALLGFLLTPLVKRASPDYVVGGCGDRGLERWQPTGRRYNHFPDYKDNIEKKFEFIRYHSETALGKATSGVQELSKELSSPAAGPAPPTSAPPRTSGVDRSTASNPAPMPEQIVEPAPNMLQAVRNISLPLLGPLGTTAVVIVFTAFMLMSRSDLRDRLIRLIAPGHLNVMTQALDEAAQRVSRYLLTQIAINAAFGSLVAIGLYFIGLPNALLWGPLTGLLRFVPYLGALIGGTLPFIWAMAVFPGWIRPMLALGLFLVIELP